RPRVVEAQLRRVTSLLVSKVIEGLQANIEGGRLDVLAENGVHWPDMAGLFARDKKILIGVVHLLPLPGSPRWGGRIQRVIERATRDADAYQRGGADAVIIENFGDLPFTKGSVAPETVAAMAAVGHEVRKVLKIPIGFNVLRNDAHAALALCAACRGDFIRV